MLDSARRFLIIVQGYDKYKPTCREGFVNLEAILDIGVSLHEGF